MKVIQHIARSDSPDSRLCEMILNVMSTTRTLVLVTKINIDLLGTANVLLCFATQIITCLVTHSLVVLLNVYWP